MTYTAACHRLYVTEMGQVSATLKKKFFFGQHWVITIFVRFISASDESDQNFPAEKNPQGVPLI